MFKTLYLIRHGRTQANVEQRYVGQTDSPLIPDNGHVFEAIGEFLRGAGVDLCYVSPIARARLTFEAMKLGKPALVDDRLKEISNGIYEGYLRGDVPVDFMAKLKADPFGTVFPQGESFMMLKERVELFFEAESPKWEGKTVAIVSHWGPNSVIAGKVLGWEVNRTDKWLQPNNVVYKFEDGKMSCKPFGDLGWYKGMYVAEQ